MKLLTYLHGGSSHWGVAAYGGVVDLGRRLPHIASVLALFEGGGAALRAAGEAVAAGSADCPRQTGAPCRWSAASRTPASG